jgi:hypothetical protein
MGSGSKRLQCDYHLFHVDLLNYCQSATVGKAIAFLEGLKLSLAYSNWNVIIETDCASIMDSFKEASFISMKFVWLQIIVSKVIRVCN